MPFSESRFKAPYYMGHIKLYFCMCPSLTPTTASYFAACVIIFFSEKFQGTHIIWVIKVEIHLRTISSDNTVNVMIRIQMALLILLDIRLLCIIQRGKNLQLVKQLPIVSPKIWNHSSSPVLSRSRDRRWVFP